MKTIDWYFDFISPFAYLQNASLPLIEKKARVRRRPVLFAGLLDHFGQLGPAEIAAKRDWTFRHVAWLAHRHGVPLKMPAMHPFNPLPLLRLSIALGDTGRVVDRLFEFVWREGHVSEDADAFARLLDELGVDASALAAPAVKDALRANGADAIAAHVFGVPTAVVEGETYWGLDATDMLIARLNDAPFFTDNVAHADARVLPRGLVRPGAGKR
jgi:2-hydroxychromene-2-carboxylate isomerase